ncbi:MAG: class I SAM-dependent methyltransferase [Deltaproteobacteria bacterium]|nr:class I SAM-dependent methyltransferase [Deltaproteobacteria bacterium]MBW2412923.1 class I SAM-dependent methyltransferase [Deltaproteobacteria bacterium]
MKIPRVHGIEIHEQPWCPPSLRDTATDYLQFVSNLTGAFSAIAPRLGEAIARSGESEVIDLCSGGGGPWLGLLAAFAPDAAPARVTLTDRFPNREAFERAVRESEGRIGFESESVDVMKVPARLRGFRTLFAALHHFRPADARAILADAAEHGQPIAIFEGTERRVSGLLAMIFLVPLMTLAVMPFVRPFRLSHLVWTYLIPAAPLVIGFDGFISCLRTYTSEELEELTAGLGGDDYVWEIGVERIGPGPMAIPFAIGAAAGQGTQTSR